MGTLFYIFSTSLLIMIVGYGVFPLLPAYATTFGAGTGSIGVFLGLVYVAISLGSMLPSWLPARISRKRIFLVGTLVGLPPMFLLGRATAFWQVVLYTSMIWFSGGVGLGLGSVYTGLLSAKGKRGRAFGLVSLATPLASLSGGLVVGRLVEWQGYTFTFTALGFMWLALPLIVIFKLDDVRPAAGNSTVGTLPSRPIIKGRAFALLMVAALFVAGSSSVGRMGVSLSMQRLAFSPADVSSTAAVSGLVLIPVVLVLSAVSDKVGARRFLVAGYLMAAAGAVLLVVAADLWHFWAATTLILVGRAVSDSLSPALASDLLPRAALQRALPRLKATNWLGGIVSFAAGGYAIELLGSTMVYIIAGSLAVMAAVSLSMLHGPSTHSGVADQSRPTQVPVLTASPAGAAGD